MPMGFGLNAAGLSHCTQILLVEQIGLVAASFAIIWLGRSFPRSVRELSVPVVSVKGWPVRAWKSGAISQLLRSAFINLLPLFQELVATSDALKRLRASEMQGPQSAWRLNTCELVEPASAAPKS